MYSSVFCALRRSSGVKIEEFELLNSYPNNKLIQKKRQQEVTDGYKKNHEKLPGLVAS